MKKINKKYIGILAQILEGSIDDNVSFQDRYLELVRVFKKAVYVKNLIREYHTDFEVKNIIKFESKCDEIFSVMNTQQCTLLVLSFQSFASHWAGFNDEETPVKIWLDTSLQTQADNYGCFSQFEFVLKEIS